MDFLELSLVGDSTVEGTVYFLSHAYFLAQGGRDASRKRSSAEVSETTSTSGAKKSRLEETSPGMRACIGKKI